MMHIRGVAEKCYELAKDKYGLDEDESRKMYLMGFLHDIGYAFSDTPESHNSAGYEMLSGVSDEIRVAILRHGNPDHIRNWTIYDEILNSADMSVSPDGKEVTYQERLNEVEIRFSGRHNKKYSDVKRIISHLNDIG